MPLREEGAKEEGAVSQNPPLSSTNGVTLLSYIILTPGGLLSILKLTLGLIREGA